MGELTRHFSTANSGSVLGLGYQARDVSHKNLAQNENFPSNHSVPKRLGVSNTGALVATRP